MLVSILFLVIMSLNVIDSQINRQIDEKMNERLERACLEIQIELTKNESIAKLLSFYGESCSRESVENGEFKAYLMKVFASNKTTMGGGIWYEPYALYPETRYFGPYIYVDENGVNYEPVYADTVDYHKTQWYQSGVSSKGKTVWSEIYYDPLTTVTMITASVPFFDKDKKPRGVATADMSITQIREIVQAITVGETGKAFILGAEGEFISYFDDSRMLESKIQNDGEPFLAELGREVLEKREGMSSILRNKKEQRVYYKTISETGWILLLLIENNEINSLVLHFFLGIALVPLITVLFAMISITFVARYLRKVVNKVKDFASNVASGDLSRRIEITEQDEFGVMEKSLNRMVNNMSAMNTRLTESLENAQNANKAKSDFLSRMSHEMRTPMNAIIGMTQVAENSSDLLKVKGCLSAIERSSKDLMALINNILDMSKIETNKLELVNERFDLRQRIQDVIEDISKKIAEKKQFFKGDIDKNLPQYIIADPLRFSQTLTHLLDNAVKFTPSGGRIALTVKKRSEDGDWYLIESSISDTGVGLSREDQKKLFNLFEQVDGGVTRKHGGVGLGLVMCKKIVGMMGGEIWLESEQGKGSTFRFTIKARKDIAFETRSDGKAEEAGFCEVAEGESCDFSGKCILLAEDIEINRQIVSALLEDTNVTIEIAENGRRACELFAADPQKYRLIFMDIQMPEIDGLEATRLIRAMPLPEAKTVPIVALTANAFPEDVEKCKAAGMNDHIAKPVDFNLLIQSMNKYVCGKRNTEA
jgi:signal transduction histidine kinase